MDDLVVRGAESLAQKLRDMTAERLVAGAPSHGADKFGKLVASPGHWPITLRGVVARGCADSDRDAKRNG